MKSGYSTSSIQTFQARSYYAIFAKWKREISRVVVHRYEILPNIASLYYISYIILCMFSIYRTFIFI